jgi:aspartyl-tRNA(Asn)/glutamyl-tRNA(Gln) amidotransferase subunit A
MLTDLTLAEARAQLRGGGITSSALTDAYLAAIAERNPQLNAYITVTEDGARAQAEAADRALAAGQAGPLTGIPLGIKDLFCTQGIRTTL